ncbi:MAG TPA: hypothetical protein VFJ45_11620 [bacterium]|nr:hypothetical protein [bacterium]
MAGDRYVRRVSSEEAREDFVLVLKDRLDFFPPVATPFHIVHEGRRFRARVTAVPCECRGPELPHEHYRIHWTGLRAGDRVSLLRDPTRSTYVALIERRHAA